MGMIKKNKGAKRGTPIRNRSDLQRRKDRAREEILVREKGRTFPQKSRKGKGLLIR